MEDGLPLRTWIGVDTNNLGVALVLPLVLTCCLFLGPLVTMAWLTHKLTVSEVCIRVLNYLPMWHLPLICMAGVDAIIFKAHTLSLPGTRYYKT